MSVRDDLHELIDQLDEPDAEALLMYARKIVDERPMTERYARSIEQRMGSLAISGRDFSSATKPLSLKELAREQGVAPVTDLERFRADFWPDDETVDEFIATIQEWRRADSRGR